ncbi:MAG: hypothetical protein HC865_00790 [Cyanobacteria bacterium RU_5_0]|nr:hypothetical protein [Cyanobacteria bacterium RU_5_0]
MAITLTEGNDTFQGTDLNEGINALGGNDTVLGGGGNDTISGGDGNDSLEGQIGDDVLTGGEGNDTLDGGNGNDTYHVDNPGDVIVNSGFLGTDPGIDTVLVFHVDFTLGDQQENLSVTGDVKVAGNDKDNLIIGELFRDKELLGNAGNDTINSGGGNDTVDGGLGNDSLDGESGDDSLRDRFGNDTLLGGNGNDTLEDLLGNNILDGGNNNDQIKGTGTLIGGEGDDNLISSTIDAGNIPGNFLDGGNGNDSLTSGAKSADTLIGGNGNDTLIAGLPDADTLQGGIGDDTYELTANTAPISTAPGSPDVLTEFAGQGTDTVKATGFNNFTLPANVENLVLLGTSFNGTGNTRNNEMTGNDQNNRIEGLAGNDTLVGAGGNDILSGGDDADVLDGGSGNDNLTGGNGDDSLTGGKGRDTFTGGLGNDTFVVDADDIIVEAANAGTDTVISTVTRTMASNLENLIQQGSGHIKTFGNILSNQITGNLGNNQIEGNDGNDLLQGSAGQDTLIGGNGKDTLIGGLGSDILQGNAGSDRFQFNAPNERVDRIVDFFSGTDKIVVSASTFGGGLVAGEPIAANQLRAFDARGASETARFIYNRFNGTLIFDADGAGLGLAGVTIAKLQGSPSLTNTDIVVITQP